MTTRDDLLRPSFPEGEGRVHQIHSSSTLFACAFFGGPFAAIAMAAINSYTLRRRGDVLPLLAATILTVTLAVAVFRPELLGISSLGHDGLPGRLVLRGFGLILFAALWWMHRSHYRGMRLVGTPVPSGIGPGILCIVLGAAVQAGLARWLEP